jgi:ABC-type transport system involved in multi-copper enzyme maturation permease subunit
MTLLPIVDRELRVASRRRGTYWTRFSAALLAIVLGAWAWAMFLKQPANETGLAIFVALSIVAYIYSLIAGAVATADCLSEEKREGTLGLLFLTDLKSYDIVLGKLAATSLGSIYGLLSIFPVMGVPLLLGGVAPAELGRVVMVCANNLFFSLALGMFFSAVCKDERKAIGFTISTIILITAVWPGAVALIASNIQQHHPFYELFHEHPEPLLAFSPGFACVFAFDIPYKAQIARASVNWFQVSVALTHVMAWLALLLANFIVPRVWQDRAVSREASRGQSIWKDWRFGSAEVRAAFRRSLLDVNPIYWLTSRERFKVMLVWVFLGAGALLWFCGYIKEERDWLNEGIYIMTALCAHSLLKCWITTEASKRLGDDLRSGALELILSTPMRVSEILHGQWLALSRQFAAAAVLVCVVDVILMAMGLNKTHNSGDGAFWVAVWFAGISIFILDLFVLPPVAIWLSLTGRKGTRAGASALVLICVVPWFLLGAFGAALALVHELVGMNMSDGDLGWLLLALWFGTSLLVGFVLGTWARRNLQEKLRVIATERTDRRAGFWARLFSKASAQP